MEGRVIHKRFQCKNVSIQHLISIISVGMNRSTRQSFWISCKKKEHHRIIESSRFVHVLGQQAIEYDVDKPKIYIANKTGYYYYY
jgi:hypothetical protein